MKNTTRGAPRCDVCFCGTMTVWFKAHTHTHTRTHTRHRTTGIVLNFSPPPQNLQMNKNRFLKSETNKGLSTGLSLEFKRFDPRQWCTFPVGSTTKNSSHICCVRVSFFSGSTLCRAGERTKVTFAQNRAVATKRQGTEDTQGWIQDLVRRRIPGRP